MVRALKYLAAVAIGCAALLTGAPHADAAFPQRAWTLPEACNSPGGPQGVTATLFPDNSGPGAYVNGNYIAFVCNYGFQRGATSAGVAVSVDYCGGTALAPRRETGNYNTLAGQFTVRSQRWITVGGALAVIVVYTNAGPGGDHFTTQEMVTGTTNLVELNRPGGAVPCPGGGATQPPGGGGGSGSGGWSVSLAADRTNLIAGNDFQLTATANKNPSGTGYRVYIVNQTENSAVFCATTAVCLHTDFLNDPGSRTYVAMIANASGQDVQATSAPITVTWSAWSGTVTLTTPDTSIPAGTTVTMTATAAPSISGTVYVIRIERQDGNGKTCHESPCTANDTYESGITQTYVAKVFKDDGTGLRATSAPLTITWEATQEWEGRVSLRANGNITNVATGRAVTLRAYVDPGLEGSNYIVQIAELVGANGQLQSCTDPDADCVLGVTSDRTETRRYQARVVRRDGTGEVKAASEVLEISWGPGGSLTPCENYWIARKPLGNVTVLIGGTIRRPVAAGDRICPDDVVETPDNGSVEAEFSERGYWNPNFGNAYTSRIGPKSQVSMWFGENNVFVTHVNLKAGDAEFTIHGAPPSDFRIKSPTAVASVRGTIVSMAYDPTTRRTTVRSLENDVEVTPTNPALGATILHGGEQVSVDASTKSAVTRIAATFANRLRLPGIAGDR